jgi:hypothetical protein
VGGVVGILRCEMGEGKDVKGIFLGCFGSFWFLLGGCFDIAWRMDGDV